jgi:hypothetical protein
VTTSRFGCEIGIRRALAPAVNDAQVAPTEAFFQAAADVPRNRVTGLHGCLQASLRNGMALDGGARRERATNTAQRGIATFWAAPKIPDSCY